MVKLRGKRIIVMGLGLHGGGMAVARFLAEEGAEVLVTDTKRAHELSQSVFPLRRYKNITFHLGGHCLADFKSADLIIQNPGVPTASRYLAYAQRAHIPILNEAALFFMLAQRPIIGVTGTRGKSTTASLVYQMLLKKYPAALLAGNIRDTVMFDIIDKARKKVRAPIVLELSSWQVEKLAVIRKSPHTAVVTNLYPDHLNRYRGLSQYYRAKHHIVLYQKRSYVKVLNYDCAPVRNIARLSPSQTLWFSKRPLLPKQNGVFTEDSFIFSKDGKRTHMVASTNTIALTGEHNLENVLAAVAVALKWEVSIQHIRATLKRFRTLKGRQELVAKKRGIFFYNDTNATTPEATEALFTAIDRPLVLIAGGNDKHLSYRNFAKAIRKSEVRAVILLPGSASKKIARHISLQKGRAVPIAHARTLTSAVTKALARASVGDAVALSPAATSFASFKHEYERGEQFTAIVQAL